MNNDFDEVAFNVLLAEGLDAPTAYAASYESEPADRETTRYYFDCGLAAGFAIVVTYWLLS